MRLLPFFLVIALYCLHTLATPRTKAYDNQIIISNRLNRKPHPKHLARSDRPGYDHLIGKEIETANYHPYLHMTKAEQFTIVYCKSINMETLLFLVQPSTPTEGLEKEYYLMLTPQQSSRGGSVSPITDQNEIALLKQAAAARVVERFTAQQSPTPKPGGSGQSTALPPPSPHRNGTPGRGSDTDSYANKPRISTSMGTISLAQLHPGLKGRARIESEGRIRPWDRN